MATPTLKYVAPTTPEDELTFAPEPVVIYGVPTGGGGGGSVDSVNGQTGTVVLEPADIGAASSEEVTQFGEIVQAALTNVENDLDSKAAITYVDNQLATKASATDLDNVFAIATAAVPQTRTVAGKALSANVTLVKGDVGLGNVDNTSDAAKPISTATQTALNGKATTAQGALADTAVQPSNPRLPLVMTQAAYNAITPVAGQVYVIQG